MGMALLIAFGALTVLSGAAIIWSGDALAKFAFIVPIIFLFIAIGAFLLLLLHYAYTLHAINPTLPVGALGLPEGSIRAFLTIGLLALVAVFGTFIYFETGRPQPAVVVRSQVPVANGEQLEEIRTSVGNRFVVIPAYKDGVLVSADVLSAEPDTTRSDVAKQLLTMIATVLTTVIGFYFGSRTESARGPDPADAKRRTEALIEMSPWTQDLDAREKALLAKADETAGEARARGDAAGEARATELKGQLLEAFTALRAAETTVAELPEDVVVVLATRDKAREALAVLKATEKSLDEMMQADARAEAGTARNVSAADATPPAP
jgi:hypothetical protein